ncbi:glycosyltransferase family 2 protein [Sphingobacterium multivorum]|uniref:glycosyltransferase family 2 protein n=1 Tax=Sphingobacterium multivorum TaxID=28454 RepID=UPI003DA3283D
MNKLLSIIIPTKNRQVYCIESIKSILNDIDDRCEIVIQDNSDDQSLKKLIDTLKSPIVKYNYNAVPLSFVDNFEMALELSTGRFFIILGDDDSTTKDILPIVEWMEKEGVESVSSRNVVDYIWPNEHISKYRNGYLVMHDYCGNITKVDVNENLKRLIENGFLAYQTFHLPRTYHGIVKRSCMDNVKQIGGRYFGGLTPDIYSTVALSCIIKDHRILDFPFSIAGACPASATVNAMVGGHSGQLEDAPHFNHRGQYTWENSIPRYYSVETIWAESAIKALEDLKYLGWRKIFNKYKLYVYGIYINKKYIFRLSLRETLKLSKPLNKSLFLHLLSLKAALFSAIFKKVKGRNKTSLSYEIKVLRNVETLDVAKGKLYQHLKGLENIFIK